uniref:Cytochrome c oxidase subunit 2 n=1 Tax=Calyptogena rectimargo TaxID=1298638 RepID=A0A8K1SUJ0_9BIVA|nr:cytochrome c oxidase subunit II [Calyptogena rectimargo]
MGSWEKFWFYDMNTVVGQELILYNDLVMVVATAVLVVVGWFMFLFLNSRSFFGGKMNKYVFHNELLEIMWTMVPAFMLCFLGYVSLMNLYIMEVGDHVVYGMKVTAHQWYWEYSYLVDFIQKLEEDLLWLGCWVNRVVGEFAWNYDIAPEMKKLSKKVVLSGEGCFALGFCEHKGDPGNKSWEGISDGPGVLGDDEEDGPNNGPGGAGLNSGLGVNNQNNGVGGNSMSTEQDDEESDEEGGLGAIVVEGSSLGGVSNCEELLKILNGVLQFDSEEGMLGDVESHLDGKGYDVGSWDWEEDVVGEGFLGVNANNSGVNSMLSFFYSGVSSLEKWSGWWGKLCSWIPHVFLSCKWNYSYEVYEIFNNFMLSLGSFRGFTVTDACYLMSAVKNELLISTMDVMHSWGVGSLGVKCDAVPGRVNSLGISPLRSGVFYGNCYELCGEGHSMMPISVAVMSCNDVDLVLKQGVLLTSDCVLTLEEAVPKD